MWGWWSWRQPPRVPSRQRHGSVKRASIGSRLARMLRARLLGELRVDVDGRPVAPPASRRAWSLLGWLALHPGEHPRGAVAACFWPDVLDSSARASLRSAAWALRRALGPEGADFLVAGRERLRLRCTTDLQELDELLARDALEAAAALHRGPLLADLD